jgi:hypothetical protein
MNYMRAFRLTARRLVSIAVVSAAMLGYSAPAFSAPDAYDILAYKLEAYYGAAKGKSNGVEVPDFTFDRSEFEGKFGAFAHLLTEAGVAALKGYKVVYNPRTNEVKVYKDAGNGYSEPIQTEASMASCGPGHWFIQNVGGEIWCTPAHLVGRSGGSYLAETIPGVERSCTWQVNVKGAHEHDC